MIDNWRVTYEIVTDESAMIGDCAESGFLNSQGERIAPIIGSATPDVEMSFRTAFNLWQQERSTAGYIEANEWPIVRPECFTDYDSPGCSFGDMVNVSIHIPSQITQASRLRLARLIGCYGIN